MISVFTPRVRSWPSHGLGAMGGGTSAIAVGAPLEHIGTRHRQLVGALLAPGIMTSKRARAISRALGSIPANVPDLDAPRAGAIVDVDELRFVIQQTSIRLWIRSSSSGHGTHHRRWDLITHAFRVALLGVRRNVLRSRRDELGPTGPPGTTSESQASFGRSTEFAVSAAHGLGIQRRGSGG